MYVAGGNMKITALIASVAALFLTASAVTIENDMLFVRALNEPDATRRGGMLLTLAERNEYPADLALIHLIRAELPQKSLSRVLPIARRRRGDPVAAVLLIRAFRQEASDATPDPMPRGELFDLMLAAWENAAERKLSPFEQGLFRELSGRLLDLACDCGETARIFPLVEKRINSRPRAEWIRDLPLAELLEFCYRHAYVAEGFELYSPEWSESPLPGRRAFAALLAESAKIPPEDDFSAMDRIRFLSGADFGDMAILLAAERLEKTNDPAVFRRRLNQLIYAMVDSGRHEIFENVRPLLNAGGAPLVEALTLANGGKYREALALLPRIADGAEKAELELNCRMALGEYDKVAEMAKSSKLPENMRAIKLLGIAELLRDGKYYTAAERVAGKLADEDIVLANAFGYTALLLDLDRDQAEKRIRHALSARPRESAYLDSLAWARYCAGDYAGAWKYMEKSLRHSTPQVENCELLAHAAAIRLALGDRDGARRYGELALKLALAGESSPRKGWLFHRQVADIRKMLEQMK